MIFAYLTHDEVNLWAATMLGRALDIELDGRAWRDGPEAWYHDAVIIDLDSLPLNEQQELLARLEKQPPRKPVAVHGYNLDAERKAQVLGNSVHVCNRLDEAVLLALQEAVRESSWATDEEPSGVSA